MSPAPAMPALPNQAALRTQGRLISTNSEDVTPLRKTPLPDVPVRIVWRLVPKLR